jgi:hypothetical protein
MAGDIKPKYLSSFSIVSSGLNSLAASSSRLAGYETAAIDLAGYSGGPLDDLILAGDFVAGGANSQAGQIDVWVIGSQNDTPRWPDVFDGTASAETVTSANILNAIGKLAVSITGDNVNSRTYDFSGVSVRSLFGASMPKQIVLFIAHNIHSGTNAWAASGSEIWGTPVLSQYT